MKINSKNLKLWVASPTFYVEQHEGNYKSPERTTATDIGNYRINFPTITRLVLNNKFGNMR